MKNIFFISLYIYIYIYNFLSLCNTKLKIFNNSVYLTTYKTKI